MPRLPCQDDPGLRELEAAVVDIRPGGILVDRSPFFPGGGGQLADRGSVAGAGGEFTVTGIATEARGTWLDLAGEGPLPEGRVLLRVDGAFRDLMSELHTVAHLVNAVAFLDFGGALLTGAQLAADGTLRVDLDLPGGDNDRLRALDGPLNAAIRRDLAVSAGWMPWTAAQAIPGMFRSKSVSPPAQEDGTVRIVAIGDMDRQACGGTHLASTGLARPVRILKVDNKGRHNRRVKVGFTELR
jgi:misacylated tRNA(Ala) deacylase